MNSPERAIVFGLWDSVLCEPDFQGDFDLAAEAVEADLELMYLPWRDDLDEERVAIWEELSTYAAEGVSVRDGLAELRDLFYAGISPGSRVRAMYLSTVSDVCSTYYWDTARQCATTTEFQ